MKHSEEVNRVPKVRITGGEWGNTEVYDEDGNKIPFVESIEWKIGGKDEQGRLDTMGFARVTLLRIPEIDIETTAEIQEGDGDR